MFKRPIGFRVAADQAYHWWTTREAGTGLPVNYQLFNGTETVRRISVEIIIRDFNGQLVQVENQQHVVSGKQLLDFSFIVPASQRQLLFVVATAATNDFVAINRTTLAILPEYEHDLSQPSIFGLANGWYLASAKDFARLLARMGVRWFRSAGHAQLDLPGISFNHHNNLSPTAFADDEAGKNAWISEQLIRAEHNRAEYWEFANEWNMAALRTGQNAEIYVKDWLVPIRQAMTGRNTPVKLAMQGIAGMDRKFVQAIYDHGGWELLDAFSLHPGRGNFTADYPNRKPAVQGNYWNYRASLERARDMIEEFGEMPLFLTEVYACTAPHGWWSDSYRHAAENTVLSLALAIANKVDRVYWYQLNDGVWWDQGGASHTDREFHFGLLHRDSSFKPSMMAYITTAEQLTGATFQGWMEFDDPQACGLAFNTPHGPVALLWHRADGYHLNGPERESYVEPEPWIDPWPTKTEIRLPAAGLSVQTIDVIGQTREIAADNDGQVLIQLDGAPLFVRGLKL